MTDLASRFQRKVKFYVGFLFIGSGHGQFSSMQLVLFATALMCEGIEGETSHSLLTLPMIILAPIVQVR